MESDEIISLTQKKLLQFTWTQLQEQINSLAHASFFSMFEAHPETLVPFLIENGSKSADGRRRTHSKEKVFELDMS